MIKIFILTLALIFNLDVLASSQQRNPSVQENKAKESALSQMPAQPSQSINIKKSADKKQDIKKPNMAEYCRKYTC